MGALYLNRGFVKMGKGDLRDAEQDFNESILLGEDSVAYSNLARLYFLKRDFNQAIVYCDKALTLDPADEIATEYKINSLKMQGKEKEAEEVFVILMRQNQTFYEELHNFFEQPDWPAKLEKLFWHKKYNF